jgi:hypothetical protein
MHLTYYPPRSPNWHNSINSSITINNPLSALSEIQSVYSVPVISIPLFELYQFSIFINNAPPYPDLMFETVEFFALHETNYALYNWNWLSTEQSISI